MLIDICLKFHEYSLLSGVQIMERPWLLVTDRQTDREIDRWTDRWTPGENNKSPNPKGGDIIKV